MVIQDDNFLQEINLDTGAFSFDIGRMDQKFIATERKFRKRFRTDPDIREPLPAIGDDIIVVTFFPAAQIEHQPVTPHGPHKTGKTIAVNPPIFENTGGHDHMRSAPVQPETGIIGGYPSADLQASRPGGKRFGSGCFVAGAQHDDMTARQVVIPVEPGIPGGRLIGGKVGLQKTGLLVTEGGADNLLHLAVMEINTWSKFHTKSIIFFKKKADYPCMSNPPSPSFSNRLPQKG